MKERFADLVAAGMAPNAAAPQALKDVQQRFCGEYREARLESNRTCRDVQRIQPYVLPFRSQEPAKGKPETGKQEKGKPEPEMSRKA